MTDTPKHSPYGPSQIARIIACPGSVRECAKAPPQPAGPHAAEGTLAHAWAEHFLRKQVEDARDYVGLTIDGEAAPRGSSAGLSADMAGNVLMYVRAVQKSAALPGAELYVERRFNLAHVEPEMWGTADAVVLHTAARTLDVFDLKYGAGVYVAATNNVQLKCYALGALAEFKSARVHTVRAHIVQPRKPGNDGAMRSVEYASFELAEFSDDLRGHIAASKAPDAPLNPGHACHFCNAKPVCPALRAKSLAATRSEFGTVALAAPAGTVLDAANLGALLDDARQAESWAKSVAKLCKTQAAAGNVPAGYELRDWAGGVKAWGVAPRDVFTAIEKLEPTAAKHCIGLLPPSTVKSQVSKTTWAALSPLLASSDVKQIAKKKDRTEITKYGTVAPAADHDANQNGE